MMQSAGISVLLYDPRNTGKSEGWPRNEIEPALQASDYYDAFTYLTSLEIVVPSQIFFWGVSLSAGIALAAAAVDKRAAGVIAVAPSFDTSAIPKAVADKIMSKAMRDRDAQMNHGNPPFFISAMEARGLVPLGSRMSAGAAPQDSSRLSHNEKGSTIQSYPKMRLWMPVPVGLLPEIAPMPVMFVTPEHDTISSPETQRRLFASLTGPKKFYLALGRGHLDILKGNTVPLMGKATIEFIWDIIGVEDEKEGDGSTNITGSHLEAGVTV